MKEAYVKFETAQHLKQKGFDWECCNHFYCRKEDGKVIERWMLFPADRNSDRWINKYAEYVSAPTQQMACRWLMEEKHIFIGKSFVKNEETLNLEFHSTVFNMDTGELITTIGAFCPEDAVEAALEYVLTKLI